MLFKAFISYSHSADGKLAPALQSALHKFAKPSYKLRAIRTFRDETTLAMTPKLWPTIQRALEESEYFLLLASPAAATSPWVQKESGWWALNRTMDKFFIVVTESDPLLQDDAELTFDFVRSRLLPESVQEKFGEQPLYLDLRWARKEEHLTLQNGKFQDQVATLSAALRNEQKDTLIGEDVRLQRRTKRLAWSAISGLVVLFLCALVGADLAFQQENIAVSRQLSAQAVSHLSDQVDLSLLLSLEANLRSAREDVRSSLLASLVKSPHLATFMRSRGESIESIAFGPKGTLASVGATDLLSVWDVSKKRLLRDLEISGTSRSGALAFSPSGELLVASSDSGTVMRWKAETLEAIGKIGTGHEYAVDRIAFRPGSNIAATASTFEDSIQLVDFAAGRLVGQKLHVSGDGVAALTFSPDGKKLVASNDSQEIFEWDLTSKTAARRVFPPGHRDRVSALAFRADGKMLASGSYDGRIILWDPETAQKMPEPLIGHTGTVFQLAFSPLDQNLLVSCGVDATVRMWNVARRKQEGTPFIGHNGPIYTMAFSPDGKMLASGGYDSAILFWDLTTPHLMARPMTGEHKDSVKSLSFSHDGKILASGSYDGTIILWDVAARKSMHGPLTGQGGAIFSVAFDPRERFLISGGKDGSILIRDTGEYVLENKIAKQNDDQMITGLAFSPDGSSFAAGTDDGTITLRDPTTGKTIGPSISTGGNYWCVLAYSPDGRTLAYGANNGKIETLDVLSRKRIGKTISATTEAVNAITFSPDGMILASASSDNTVTLWDSRTHDMIGRPLRGHSLPVFTVAFSPDSRMLASGSADGTIILWDLSTHEPFGRFSIGDDNRVFAVSFSPDGKILASGGPGGELLLWDLDFDSWKRRACSLANRNLTYGESQTYLETWRHHFGLDSYRKTCEELPSPTEAR